MADRDRPYTPTFVLLRGVNFVNKGALLLLEASVQALRSRRSGVQLAIEPFQGFNDFSEFSHLQLRLLPKLRKYGVDFGAPLRWIPKKYRCSLGIVRRRDVSAVLDLSGYAFGDPWGTGPLRSLRYEAHWYRRRGIPVILMPQALGPFNNRVVATAAAAAFAEVSQIVARDRQSEESVAGLRLPQSTGISSAPDITVSFKVPMLPTNYSGRLCIVPNVQMLAQRAAESKQYSDLLSVALRTGLDIGLNPFFLVHGGQRDAELIRRSGLAESAEVYEPRTAVEAKQILATSRVVFASRFHAAVSALSSAVPAVVTSWSHKYEQLLAEFGVPELLVPTETGSHMIAGALDSMAADSDQRARIVGTLRESTARMSRDVGMLWDHVVNEVLPADS